MHWRTTQINKTLSEAVRSMWSWWSNTVIQMHGAGKRANHCGSSRRGLAALLSSAPQSCRASPNPRLLRLHLVSVTPAACLSSRLLPLLYFKLSRSTSDPPYHGVSRRVSKMLACTEMITMCLQSAKQKHLRAQQHQQPLHSAGQGLTIFHDVSALTLLLYTSPWKLFVFYQIITAIINLASILSVLSNEL